VIVRFVHIGRIVDHQSLNFLFITSTTYTRAWRFQRDYQNP